MYVLMMMILAAVQGVSYEFEPGADFAGYKTYAWVKADAIPLATARPQMPIEETDRLLRAAIDKQLAGKGLRKASADQADLLVAYQGVVRAQVEVDDQPYSQSGNFKAAVVRRGTLTVDLVERSSRRLLWRASVTESAVGETDNTQAVVDEMVERVMSAYPPQ